jgi:hypothetical protein
MFRSGKNQSIQNKAFYALPDILSFKFTHRRSVSNDIEPFL